MLPLGLNLTQNANAAWNTLISDAFSNIFEKFFNGGKIPTLKALNSCSLVCHEWNQNVQKDIVLLKILQCFDPNFRLETGSNFKGELARRANFWLNVFGEGGFFQLQEFAEDPLISSRVSYFEQYESPNVNTVNKLRCKNLVFTSEASTTQIKVVNLTSKIKKLNELKCSYPVVHFQCNPNKSVLAITRLCPDTDFLVALWDVNPEGSVTFCEGNAHKISAVSYDDFTIQIDNNTMFGAADNAIKAWALSDLSSQTYIECLEEVKHLQMSRDEKRLFYKQGNSYCIWNLSDKKLEGSFTLESSHQGKWLESEDGQFIFGLCKGEILIYSLETKRLFRENHLGDFPTIQLCGLTNTDQPLLEIDGKLRCLDFNFNCKNTLREIQELAFSSDEKELFAKFKSLPLKIQHEIFGELYKIMRFENPYWGCAEDAFFNQNGQKATWTERANAIGNFLKK